MKVDKLIVSLLLATLLITILPTKLLCENELMTEMKVEIFLEKGYAIYKYHVKVPKIGLYTLRIPKEFLNRIAYVNATSEVGEVKCEVKHQSIMIHAKCTNFTLTIVTYKGIERSGRQMNMSLLIYLAFNELPSRTNVTVYSKITPFKLNLAYYVRYGAANATIYFPHASSGEYIITKAIFSSVFESWIIAERFKREVYINNCNEIVVIDYYYLKNYGPVRSSSITIELPLNASIIEVRGPLMRYVVGYGAGKYVVSTEGNYTRLRIDPLAPPAYGEIYELYVKYKVPIIKMGNDYILEVLKNPGFLVVNGTVKVYILGSIKFAIPKPKLRFTQGDYEVLVYDIQPCKEIREIPQQIVLNNLSINTVKYWLRVLRPYLIGIGIPVALIVALSLIAYQRLIPKVAKKRIRHPEIVKLCSEYLNTLREEKESVMSYVQGKISRRVYRQQIELLKSRRNTIRERIEKIIEEEGIYYVRDLVQKMYDLENDFRRKLSELRRARGRRFREVSDEIDRILSEIGKLIE